MGCEFTAHDCMRDPRIKTRVSHTTSELRLSVLTKIYGESGHLKINRVSKETISGTARKDDDEQIISLQKYYPHPHSAEIKALSTAKDVHEEVFDIFLQGNDHTSEAFATQY